MKTQAQNKKLDFKKNGVVELNNSQMQNVCGGTFFGITDWLTGDPNGSSNICQTV